MSKTIRVLIAKPGLDGHDRGAKIIAKAFRDAGMEVIYTGLHQTPAMIVQAALDEDVHVIGLSILSGAHERIVEEIFKLLKAAKAEDVVVIVGGTIPQNDHKGLLKQGVKAIFTSGSRLDEMIAYVRKQVNRE